MSVTGHWIVGSTEPAFVEELRSTASASAYTPLPVDAGLEWWSAMDDAALAEPAKHGHGSHCPTDAALCFVDAIEAHRPDPEFRDRCMDAFDSASTPEIFHVGMRRGGDPVAALCYGLGFSAARRLPGRFGCFVLDATEVRSSMNELEALLQGPGLAQRDFAARCAAWISVMADEPNLDPLMLLSGPLGVLRDAEARGFGAVGVMQWY